MADPKTFDIDPLGWTILVILPWQCLCCTPTQYKYNIIMLTVIQCVIKYYSHLVQTSNLTPSWRSTGIDS